MSLTILHGDLIDAPEPHELRVRPHAWLIAENGVIRSVTETLPGEYAGAEVTELGRGLCIPAFSDLHIHMSQYVQRGIGMDKLLSDWLQDYTFPQESRFRDESYAAAIYDKATRALLREGTFHAAMFTTIHPAACDILFRRCQELGLQALIGKVNMDRNAPDYLREDTAASLRETEEFVAGHGGDRDVKPILTPRFAPTSSPELMRGLGKLAEKYGLGLQTHLVESRWEARAALELFPECRTDTEIYERYGLLGHGPAIFAHVIFPEALDKELLGKYDALCVHCPEATTNVIAGIMPSERLRREGLRVALGTDVGAGEKPAVYRQIAWAVQLSKQRSFYFPEESGALSFSEAFHMATAEGGRVFDRVGLLEPGCRMDALVIQPEEEEEFPLTPAERLERFCYCGDDRNILRRYLSGKELLSL